MENSELIKVILTSSLVSGFFSVIISYFVSMKLKNLDYKNEYYKKILEKRLEAYKFLEGQIAIMKSSVLDEDGMPFHMIFASGKLKFIEYQQNLNAAMVYGMWINDSTMHIMEKLNDLFFKISREMDNESEHTINLGKGYYKEIAKQRNILEDSIRKDILELYDFKKFKKNAISGSKRIVMIEK